jgi:ATP-dependent Clp protease ATP-binding subunit ClpA
MGQGRSMLYKLAPTHPMTPIIQQMFVAEKAHWDGLLQSLRDITRQFSDIEACWYYGSVARGEDLPASDLDIAIIVSKITGIPVDTMLTSEKDKLLAMEAHLMKSVIGQEAAIAAVSDAVRRSRAGISDHEKPLGSFLFLGPTGVGKTELTKALAEFLFDDRSAILRIDMSEYMEKHAVARLIGAPPGYVGYEQGGALTESVRRRPYQVILFDEIEKAHPDIFNIMLQILDEGRLTDSQGNLVDFKNTLIILTSNLGAEVLVNQKEGEDTELLRGQVMNYVNAAFRPEFLNRLDEIILFHRLNRTHMGDIVKIQLGILKKVLAAQHIDLKYDDLVIKWLADKGYDPKSIRYELIATNYKQKLPVWKITNAMRVDMIYTTPSKKKLKNLNKHWYKKLLYSYYPTTHNA